MLIVLLLTLPDNLRSGALAFYEGKLVLLPEEFHGSKAQVVPV
jgi:hypothetical protein